MIKPIQNISTINKLSQISKLPTISQIEQLKQITPAYKKQSAIQTALADYNNAMEINSIADAISNADANTARWGEAVSTLPFLPTILSAGEHIYKHWLQPVFKGDFKTAGLNILTELSEDTDMFAQPFKALTIGGTEGFKENLEHGGAAGFGGLLGTAVGTVAGVIIGAVTGGAGTAIIPQTAIIGQAAGTMIGSYAQHLFADKDNLKGKTNYDYDTGNLAADMALEVISDPMDWISIATAPVKIGAGIASGVATKSITKTAVNTLEEAGQTVNKSLRKTIKNTVKNIPTAISKSDEAVTNLGQVAKLISDKPFEGETLATLSKLQIDKISSTGQRELLTKTGTILDSLNTLDEIMDGKKYKKPVYDSDGNIKYYVTKKTWGIDPSTRLLKMSLGYTPLGIAIPIIKRVVPYIGSLIKLRRISINAPKYFNENGKLNLNIISEFYKNLAGTDAELSVMASKINMKNSDESAELFEKLTEDSLKQIIKDIDDTLGDLNNVLKKGQDTLNKKDTINSYQIVYDSLNNVFKSLFRDFYNTADINTLKQKIYNKILNYQSEINYEVLQEIADKIENIKTILKSAEELNQITKLDAIASYVDTICNGDNKIFNKFVKGYLTDYAYKFVPDRVLEIKAVAYKLSRKSNKKEVLKDLFKGSEIYLKSPNEEIKKIGLSIQKYIRKAHKKNDVTKEAIIKRALQTKVIREALIAHYNLIGNYDELLKFNSRPKTPLQVLKDTPLSELENAFKKASKIPQELDAFVQNGKKLLELKKGLQKQFNKEGGSVYSFFKYVLIAYTQDCTNLFKNETNNIISLLKKDFEKGLSLYLSDVQDIKSDIYDRLQDLIEGPTKKTDKINFNIDDIEYVIEDSTGAQTTQKLKKVIQSNHSEPRLLRETFSKKFKGINNTLSAESPESVIDKVKGFIRDSLKPFSTKQQMNPTVSDVTKEIIPEFKRKRYGYINQYVLKKTGYTLDEILLDIRNITDNYLRITGIAVKDSAEYTKTLNEIIDNFESNPLKVLSEAIERQQYYNKPVINLQRVYEFFSKRKGKSLKEIFKQGTENSILNFLNEDFINDVYGKVKNAHLFTKQEMYDDISNSLNKVNIISPDISYGVFKFTDTATQSIEEYFRYVDQDVFINKTKTHKSLIDLIKEFATKILNKPLNEITNNEVERIIDALFDLDELKKLLEDTKLLNKLNTDSKLQDLLETITGKSYGVLTNYLNDDYIPDDIDLNKLGKLIAVAQDMSAINDEFLEESAPLIEELLTESSEITRFVKSVLFKDNSDGYIELQNKVKSLKATINFRDNLYYKIAQQYSGNVNEIELVFKTVWSQMNNLHRFKLSTFINNDSLSSVSNFDFTTRGFFDLTNVFLAGAQSVPRFTNENIPELLGLGTTAQFMKGYEDKLHNAYADTKLSSNIFRALRDKGIIDKNKKLFIYDLETTGVEQSSKIREISVRDIDGNSLFHRYITLSNEEFNELLTDSFKSRFEIKAESAEEYNTVFLNSKVKELEELGEETKIQNLEDALKDFEEFLMPQLKDVDSLLCGHNIKKFDNIVMRNNINGIKIDNPDLLQNLSAMFNENSLVLYAATLDSLELAYKQRGIVQLTNSDKNIILNEIKKYINTLRNISNNNNRAFLDCSPAGMWDIISNALKDYNLINKRQHIPKTTISDTLENMLNKLEADFRSTYNSFDLQGTRTATGERSFTVTLFQLPELEDNQSIALFRVRHGDQIYEARTLPALLSKINYSASYPIDENVSKFFNINNLYADIKHGARSNKVLKAPKRYVNAILNYVKGYRYTSFLLRDNLPNKLRKCIKALQEYNDTHNVKLIGLHYLSDLKTNELTPAELLATVQFITAHFYKPFLDKSIPTPTDKKFVDFFNWFSTEYGEILDIFKSKACYKIADLSKSFEESTNIFEEYGKGLQHITDEITDETELLNQTIKLQEQIGIDKLITQRHIRKQALLTKLNDTHKKLIDLTKDIADNTTDSGKNLRKIYNSYNDNFKAHTKFIVNKLLDLDDDELIMFVYAQHGTLAINKNIDNYDKLIKKLINTGRITISEYTDKAYAVLDNSIKIKLDRKSKTLTYNKKTINLKELLQDSTIYNWNVEGTGELGTTFSEYITTLKELIECDDTEIIHFLSGVQTPDTVHKFYDSLPDTVQVRSRKLEDMLNVTLFDWDSNIIPDYSTIGFNKSVYVNFYNIIRNNVRKVINNEKAIITINELMSNPYYATSWSKAAAEIADDSAYGKIQKSFNSNTLLTFLSEHPEYDLYIRTIDANGKVKVISLPRTSEAINKAYELGYTINLETRQVGSLLMDTLNYSNNSAFLTTARSIIKLFKAGFLAFPGTWVRNMLDSYIKNVEDMGSVNATTNTFKAIVIHHEWYKHYNNIIKLGQFNAKSNTWFREATHSYFLTVGATKAKYLDEHLFLNIYDFMNEGPSSAILKDLDLANRLKTKYAITQNVTGNMTVPELKKWYKLNKIKAQGIVDAMDDMSNKFLYAAVAPNHYIEQINRLAMFLHYTDEGFLTTNKVYDRIAKVHFDFTYKSDFDKYMELVMPFYSFFKENTAFWIEAVENNPAFFRRIVNIMQPVANLDEYEHEELERNQSLQNQILTGQIVLDETANLTIKLNPSFLDVLSLFNNPVEALEQRLVDPLKFGINLATQETLINDYGDLLRNLPIVGAVTTRAEMIKRNLERVENNAQLDDTQKLAVKPFAAISSLFGVTQRYNIQKYNNDIYYTQRSSEYYKNSKPKLYNTNEYINYNRQRPIKKLYFPLEAPKGNSNAWYRYLYTKSVQRYLNN